MSTTRMHITVDELKLLLTLNGNQRIEHLEDEIFANNTLTGIYLQCMMKLLDRWCPLSDEDLNKIYGLDQIDWYDTEIQCWALWRLLDFGIDGHKQRFTAAEHIIHAQQTWKYETNYSYYYKRDIAES